MRSAFVPPYLKGEDGSLDGLLIKKQENKRVELSEKVKALIAKARIVNVQQWDGTIDSPVIALVQSADDEGRYLTDGDFEQMPVTQFPHQAIARQLRDQAAEIVDEARQGVLTTFPEITEPGGGLFPPVRAEACWRDFWHFLRCMTYGIAASQVNYTSEEGLGYMQELYQELQVPLEAMVLGLEGIKSASLKRVDELHQEALAPYFDHLIEQLRQFRTP